MLLPVFSTLLIVLLPAAAFIVGVLTGLGITTRAQDTRDRRQAVAQRHLNERYRALREHQETFDEGAV